MEEQEWQMKCLAASPGKRCPAFGQRTVACLAWFPALPVDADGEVLSWLAQVYSPVATSSIRREHFVFSYEGYVYGAARPIPPAFGEVVGGAWWNVVLEDE